MVVTMLVPVDQYASNPHVEKMKHNLIVPVALTLCNSLYACRHKMHFTH